MTKVYLAGPMRRIENYNFPQFEKITRLLREHGFEVVNPVELDLAVGHDPREHGEQTFREYMERDLPAVLTCDVVVLLAGWENSKGARLEVDVAHACGVPVYTWPTITEVCPGDSLQEPSVTTTSGATSRRFDTGATRDVDTNKYDYEGFLSPLVLRRFGSYMHEHRLQRDGTTRASDNWQRGIPLDAYIKSLLRHTIDVWTLHRGYATSDFAGELVSIEDALCGVFFNAQGYLHELLKQRVPDVAT